MMATKDPVHQALHAFAKGDVEAAGSILTATAGEAKARSDVESALDACCMQASLAAMEGSVVEVRRALGEAGAPSRGLIEAMQHYMEGLAALSNANYTTARRKFEAARACDSKFVLASMGLAAVYYEAKDYKKSFGEYREVISALGSEVTPPLARVGMGLCAFRLGKIPFAKKCLERALALNPDDELALLALLVVYLDLRLLSQASETVHQLQRLLPHNATVLLKVGDLLYFKSLMERRLGHVLRPLQTLLAAVRQLGTKEERAMADFQEGRALLAAGDWSAAQSRLEAALRALPHLLAARVHYARLLYYTNKVDEAVALLRSIHEQRPQEKEVLQLLALHATRTGDHSAALRYCSLLIHSNAQGDPATWALASWCARLDVEESAKLVSHVIRVSHDVGQSPPFTLLANLAVLRKDVTALQAIVDAEMGVTFLTTNAPLDVQHVPLLFNLALLLEATDRTRARSLYLYLIKQQSHFTLPYFRLHDMAKEDGQVRQAVAWLTLLQQVVPDASLASAYIGQDFYDQQRHMACMEALRVQRSKSVPVALALGKSFLWCAQQRGKDSQRFLSSAKDRFLYALRQDSDNLLALHGLACCLGLEKDYDHCQSFLHRVGEAVPNVEAVRENYSVHMANVMLLCEAYKQSIDHFEQHEGSLTAAQSSAFAFCLASEARYTEAIELLEKTLTDPAATKSFPMLPYNLALLYYAHFDRIITRSASLTAEDARKLQEGLERGLSLSHAFVQQEARTQSIVTAQSFLRSVSATCLRLYETSLKQLVLMGVEKEAQIGPASQRWASAFEQYTKEMDEAREQLECMTQQEVADRDRREQVIAAERVDDQGVPVEITFDV